MFENKATAVISFAALLYFIWMDIALFYQVQSRMGVRHSSSPHGTATTPAVTVPQMLSPFTGLSVKLIMTDPVNNYVHVPAAHIFNEVSRVGYFHHYKTRHFY